MGRARGLAVALGAVCALWASQAAWPVQAPGQDVAPYVVQAQFVGVRDDLVFPPAEARFGALPTEVVEAQCALLVASDASPDEVADCARFAVPPLATPPAVVGWVTVAHLPYRAVRALVQLAGAAAFALGTVVLWRRLGRRHGDAGRVTVVLSALALTPLVLRAGQLGQTSGVLYLSAALAPIPIGGRLRRTAASLVWAGAAVLKGVPALLAVLQAGRRRWASLVVAAAVALVGVVGLLALVPATVVADAGAGSWSLTTSALDVPANRSLATQLAAASGLDAGAAVVLSAALVLAALGAAWWRWLRAAPAEVEWAWWSLGLVAASPILWGHYTAVAVVVLGLALARLAPQAADTGTDALLDRRLLALPVTAAVLAMASLQGTDVAGSAAVRALTYGVLVAVLAAVVVIVHRTRPPQGRPA